MQTTRRNFFWPSVVVLFLEGCFLDESRLGAKPATTFGNFVSFLSKYSYIPLAGYLTNNPRIGAYTYLILLTRQLYTQTRNLGSYFNHPLELIARMAQLKNYFGITDDTPLTPAHIWYAKKHYAKKHGELDNHMTTLLSHLNEKNIDIFLRVLNSIGV